MPASHFIDKESHLIVTVWEGGATDMEFINALIEYQNDIQNHPDLIDYNEVVDLSKMTNVKLSTEGIKKIGNLASETDRNDFSRKMAIIVGSDLAYGLSRMYEAYRNFSAKSNKEIRTFRKKKDAYDWVEGQS